VTSSWKSPRALPVDPALPELAELTDPELAVKVLSFRSPWPLESARVRYLEHDPGRSFLIHLHATSGAERHDVVVSRSRDLDSEGGGTDNLRVAWFPMDHGLPMLADPARLTELLQLDPDCPHLLLAWVPQHRAVLRVGDVVVKLYPTVAQATVSRDHLETVSRLLPSAHLVRAEVAAGAVAQTALNGEPLTRNEALPEARAAARVARTLHAATSAGLTAGLREHTPEAMLEMCDPVIRLTAFAQPELAARIHTLVDRLRESAPVAEQLVLSHGDFNWGQLIRTPGGELALLDTDTLCVAPAAFDLASYATNLASGRDQDLTLAMSVIDELVEGYGARPPDLQWWLTATLLRRLDRALRRLKRDWPQRTETLLSAAERTMPG
jgi:thiamine kinase-like enzyme